VDDLGEAAAHLTEDDENERSVTFLRVVASLGAARRIKERVGRC